MWTRKLSATLVSFSEAASLRILQNFQVYKSISDGKGKRERRA
jgi:hypothetical protein